MLTITISTRALLIALIVAAFAIAAVFVSDALAGDDSQVQGDVNCDEAVNADDVLDQLYDAAGFQPIQNEPCTDIGDAFPLGGGEPGPSGVPGPSGPPGPSGAPGINLFASVDWQGVIETGDAVSVEKLNTGLYDVTFPQEVYGCAAIASAGAHGSANHIASGAANASLYESQPDEVRVLVVEEDGTPADSEFFLIVAC